MLLTTLYCVVVEASFLSLSQKLILFLNLKWMVPFTKLLGNISWLKTNLLDAALMEKLR